MLAKKAWSLIGTVSALLAGMLAKNAVEAAWRKTTGKEPPANPESPETTWREAVAFAVVSGVALGLARLVARGLAAGGWRKTTGNLPPGLESVS